MVSKGGKGPKNSDLDLANSQSKTVAEADHAEPEEKELAEGVLPNINLPVIVALGRSFMSIKEVLKLRPGQILELKKNPNEPVDLVVNGKVVAKGELVDVDGRLAVRLVKIVE